MIAKKKKLKKNTSCIKEPSFVLGVWLQAGFADDRNRLMAVGYVL